MTTQELLGLIDHGADWDDGDREARARRSAWLCFERRRSQVAAGLRRPKLPRNRYEDLRLAADLCRVEGRCLVRPGQEPAPAEQCLITGLKLQLSSVQVSLERTERWLSLEGRRRATAAADKRFRTIADEVRAELVSRGVVVVPSRAKPEPRTAAAHLCEAMTRKGARCKNRAKAEGVCVVHARVRESAVLPDGHRTAHAQQRDRSGSGSGVGLRQPAPRPLQVACAPARPGPGFRGDARMVAVVAGPGADRSAPRMGGGWRRHPRGRRRAHLERPRRGRIRRSRGERRGGLRRRAAGLAGGRRGPERGRQRHRTRRRRRPLGHGRRPRPELRERHVPR